MHCLLVMTANKRKRGRRWPIVKNYFRVNLVFGQIVLNLHLRHWVNFHCRKWQILKNNPTIWPHWFQVPMLQKHFRIAYLVALCLNNEPCLYVANHMTNVTNKIGIFQQGIAMLLLNLFMTLIPCLKGNTRLVNH